MTAHNLYRISYIFWLHIIFGTVVLWLHIICSSLMTTPPYIFWPHIICSSLMNTQRRCRSSDYTTVGVNHGAHTVLHTLCVRRAELGDIFFQNKQTHVWKIVIWLNVIFKQRECNVTQNFEQTFFCRPTLVGKIGNIPFRLVHCCPVLGFVISASPSTIVNNLRIW
jgi:hypothetical protein